VLLFAEEFDDKINLWCGFYIVFFNWIFWFEILVILFFGQNIYLFFDKKFIWSKDVSDIKCIYFAGLKVLKAQKKIKPSKTYKQMWEIAV